MAANALNNPAYDLALKQALRTIKPTAGIPGRALGLLAKGWDQVGVGGVPGAKRDPVDHQSPIHGRVASIHGPMSGRLQSGPRVDSPGEHMPIFLSILNLAC